MMRQVFISYKHEQLDLAQSVERELNKADFVCWMDRDIRVGTEWREKIDLEIRKSIALVVLMTREAKASEYVTYEWSFAYGAGVRVIPLIYDIGTDEIHTRLQTLQYVKYNEPDIWDKLINSLRDAQSSYLSIYHAVWGARDKMYDVTPKVREIVSSEKPEIVAHKDIFGDPIKGERKKLVVFYSVGGKVNSVELDEHQKLSFQ